MKLAVSKKSTEKPVAPSNGGRAEDPEWAELAAVVFSQTPGEWVLYKKYENSTEAVRVGLRFRQGSSYGPGKAFGEKRSDIGVAILGERIDEETGKKIASTWLAYKPEAGSKPTS